MLSEITVADITAKFPGLFQNPRNKRVLFTSRDKRFLIEETKLKGKNAYQVMEVRIGVNGPELHLGKYYHSIEDVEAEFATQIDL